tara:strand:+ start:723 stop:1421 length:699 start_codon:yes stop_codon:yes gene_type:complete
MISKDKYILNLENKIKKIFDYDIKDPKIFIKALTHKSFSKENYERLEFLGDAVLQLVITEYLYDKYPNHDEGSLSREKQFIVSKKTISEISIKSKIINLLISKNLNFNKDRSLQQSIASNVMESIIGAIFIDGDYNSSKRSILKIFSEYLSIKDNIGLKDPKTLLQEHMHSLGEDLPKYITKKLSGPSHKPKFEVTCKINTLETSVSSIATTVQEGQQIVSKLILEKIHGKK